MLSNDELWAGATAARPVFKNMDSQYTIDYGCKIERYDSGKISIYNCRLGGDWYKRVTDLEMFYQEGFDIAALQMGIDTMSSQVKRLESKLDKKDDNRLRQEIKNIQEKIDSYITTRDYLRNQGRHA